MPRYACSLHAVERARERFPQFARIKDLPAWIAEQAAHARVAGNQAGFDLMLRIEVDGEVIFLPVSPLGHHDTWIVRTVLTEEHGRHNLAMHRRRSGAAAAAAWKERQQRGPRVCSRNLAR